MNRTAAAHGLTYADVWSDRRLAEFAVSIPQPLLDFSGSVDKRFVRTALRHIIPDSFLQQAKKTRPDEVYRQAIITDGAPLIMDLLKNSIAHASGYIDAKVLRDSYALIQESGEPVNEFWWAVSLELWLRRVRPEKSSRLEQPGC